MEEEEHSEHESDESNYEDDGHSVNDEEGVAAARAELEKLAAG